MSSTIEDFTKTDDDFVVYEESKLQKKLDKNRSKVKSLLSRARRTLKTSFRNLKKFWDVWVRFQKNPVLVNMKSSQVDEATFDVPGFEEIACIEAELPDIMTTDMDRIRTSCKEYSTAAPQFPSREQVKQKLIAADKYYGVRSAPVDEAEYSQRASWRFILDRPLVEQYVLMTNYIRKISIMSELRGEKPAVEVAEVGSAEEDVAYGKFARTHRVQTKRLHLSIARQRATTDSGVQTAPRGSGSEFSLYPNSDMSGEVVSTDPKQQTSSPLVVSDVEDKTMNARTGDSVNWWEPANRPLISEAFPTSSESVGKLASGSGSDGLSIPVHSTTGDTSLFNRAVVDRETDYLVSESNKTHLPLFSANIPIHINIRQSCYEPDQSLTSVRSSSARDTTEGSSSTSNDRIALKASPAVLFQPGQAIEGTLTDHSDLEGALGASLAQLEVVRCDVGKKQVVLLKPDDKVTLTRRPVGDVALSLKTPPVSSDIRGKRSKSVKTLGLLGRSDMPLRAVQEAQVEEREDNPTAELVQNKEYQVPRPITSANPGLSADPTVSQISGSIRALSQSPNAVEVPEPIKGPELPSPARSIVELKNIFENKTNKSVLDPPRATKFFSQTTQLPGDETVIEKRQL